MEKLTSIPANEIKFCPKCGARLQIDRECEDGYLYCPGIKNNQHFLGEEENQSHFSIRVGGYGEEESMSGETFGFYSVIDHEGDDVTGTTYRVFNVVLCVEE